MNPDAISSIEHEKLLAKQSEIYQATFKRFADRINQLEDENNQILISIHRLNHFLLDEGLTQSFIKWMENKNYESWKRIDPR